MHVGLGGAGLGLGDGTGMLATQVPFWQILLLQSHVPLQSFKAVDVLR